MKQLNFNIELNPTGYGLFNSDELDYNFTFEL